MLVRPIIDMIVSFCFEHWIIAGISLLFIIVLCLSARANAGGGGDSGSDIGESIGDWFSDWSDGDSDGGGDSGGGDD